MKKKSPLKNFDISLKTNEFLMNQYHFTKSILTGQVLQSNTHISNLGFIGLGKD